MNDRKRLLKGLGKLLQKTRDDEVDCDQYTRHLAAWIDGGIKPELAELLEHHRSICPECDEERAALVKALTVAEDQV